MAWRWTNGTAMIQIKSHAPLDKAKANDGFFVGWPYVLLKKIIWFITNTNSNHVCFSLVTPISWFKTFWEYFSSKSLTNCLSNCVLSLGNPLLSWLVSEVPFKTFYLNLDNYYLILMRIHESLIEAFSSDFVTNNSWGKSGRKIHIFCSQNMKLTIVWNQLSSMSFQSYFQLL